MAGSGRLAPRRPARRITPAVSQEGHELAAGSRTGTHSNPTCRHKPPLVPLAAVATGTWGAILLLATVLVDGCTRGIHHRRQSLSVLPAAGGLLLHIAEDVLYVTSGTRDWPVWDILEWRIRMSSASGRGLGAYGGPAASDQISAFSRPGQPRGHQRIRAWAVVAPPVDRATPTGS
jgi:hypothetical protein